MRQGSIFQGRQGRFVGETGIGDQAVQTALAGHRGDQFGGNIHIRQITQQNAAMSALGLDRPGGLFGAAPVGTGMDEQRGARPGQTPA